ncbi:MAG TPA: hypothetical protein VFC19_18025 [Candidatus Limnocylindrales bacterium]|nr:hypothetical protein [Candidatus Limnocylindrales bacterium]
MIVLTLLIGVVTAVRMALGSVLVQVLASLVGTGLAGRREMEGREQRKEEVRT